MPKRVTKDLTDVRVRNAKPSDAQYEIFDRAVGGFALRVHPSGSKTFVVNFRCNGKSRRMTLGNAAVMSLTKAREEAMTAKAKAKTGIDPIEEKHRQDQEIAREQQRETLKDERTFAAVSDLYIQRYARGRSKTPKKKPGGRTIAFSASTSFQSGAVGRSRILAAAMSSHYSISLKIPAAFTKRTGF